MRRILNVPLFFTERCSPSGSEGLGAGLGWRWALDQQSSPFVGPQSPRGWWLVQSPLGPGLRLCRMSANKFRYVLNSMNQHCFKPWGGTHTHTTITHSVRRQGSISVFNLVNIAYRISFVTFLKGGGSCCRVSLVCSSLNATHFPHISAPSACTE